MVEPHAKACIDRTKIQLDLTAQPSPPSQSGSGPGGAVLGNVAVAGGTCDGSDTTTPYKLKSFTKWVALICGNGAAH